MTWLQKAWQLSPCERRLVMSAGLVCVAIRVGLLLVRLQILKLTLDWISDSLGAPSNPYGLSPAQIGRAVTAASRLVPGSTCLTRALAVAFLLDRRKYPANLRIGFARTPGHGLQGHAWVESEGRIVIGEGDLSGYTALPLWGSPPSGIGWAA